MEPASDDERDAILLARHVPKLSVVWMRPYRYGPALRTASWHSSPLLFPERNDRDRPPSQHGIHIPSMLDDRIVILLARHVHKLIVMRMQPPRRSPALPTPSRRSNPLLAPGRSVRSRLDHQHDLHIPPMLAGSSESLRIQTRGDVGSHTWRVLHRITISTNRQTKSWRLSKTFLQIDVSQHTGTPLLSVP